MNSLYGPRRRNEKTFLVRRVKIGTTYIIPLVVNFHPAPLVISRIMSSLWAVLHVSTEMRNVLGENCIVALRDP